MKEDINQVAMKIRTMTLDDIAALVDIESQCFTDPWSENMVRDLACSSWDEVWVLVLAPYADVTERISASVDIGGTESVVSDVNSGKIAGYINYRFIAGEGELMRIAVLPEYRGHGYSRKLMDIMVENASKNQITDLSLEVRAGNTPAISLYKSYGFAKEALRKGYYHNPTEDALIMWLRGLPHIPT